MTGRRRRLQAQADEGAMKYHDLQIHSGIQPAELMAQSASDDACIFCQLAWCNRPSGEKVVVLLSYLRAILALPRASALPERRAWS